MTQNQTRANALIATGHPFSAATMQCLTFIALCAYDPRDTNLLDKIERDMKATGCQCVGCRSGVSCFARPLAR